MSHDQNDIPAFPFIEAREGYRQMYSPGLSKREYFAGLAPETIPDWFEGTYPEKPTAPQAWTSLPDSDPNKKALQAWHWDPIYDLPDELQWYQRAWSKFWSDERNWETENRKIRYFQWRVFYSEALLKELEK